MRSLRFMAKWVAVLGLFLGSLVALQTFYGADDAGQVRSGPAAVSGSHETLQNDADMTQRMSTPNADTGSSAHRGDDQLARSQNQGYLRALEQHQAQIDQMLARGTP